MRTFIAVELNTTVQNELSELIRILRKSDADVKWVDPSNIHLTLKFLGEIDDAQAADVKTALNEISKNFSSFSLRLAGIGAFPRPEFPRVVWVGIDEGAQESKSLAKIIEDSLAQIGFPREERAFSAHITLGRVRSPRNKSRLLSSMEKEKDFALKSKVSVDKLVLFRSTLTPDGAVYAPLGEFKLANSGL